MTGIIVELCTNLFQAFMFISFIYMFFDKPDNKKKSLISYFAAGLCFFGVATFFTLSGNIISTPIYYVDSLIYILILEIYSVCFLRGKLYLRVLMPLVAFGINAILSYTFGYFVSFVTGQSFEEAFVISSEFRYFCIVVVNLTNALLFWIIAHIGSNRIQLSGASEITAFIIVPVLCMVVVYCNFFAYQVSGFNQSILLYLLIICFVIVGIAALVAIMLVRISKANMMKTEFLLTAQREQLYEESIIASNEQIKKISDVKHDMKNKISSLEKLVSDGSYEEAMKLCEDTTSKLEATFTPLHSSNPVLNAIVNVEMEKASSLGIDFSIDIGNALNELSSSDLVSVIGNLCDNAIEYLANEQKDLREMYLQIHSHLDFYIITCKNKISKSVLDSNPDFVTTKPDKGMHGKGMGILRRIAKEYNGDVRCSEEEGYFIVNVILKFTKSD